MITDNQLRQIMPNLNSAKRALYLPFLGQAMEEFQINSPLRAAAFLAQIAHESGEFRWMEEIWGPTSAQRRYEPPGQKAARLGNTQPGDGKRFKGRGPIQLTGRFNYQLYGSQLGVDLVSNPPLAAEPQVAFRTAALYWKKNGLNELADVQAFKTITKRINGGFNGLADRQKYYARARAVLGVGGGGGFGITDVEDADAGAETTAPVSFTRGLDEPGEVTPTAAERNAPQSKTTSTAAKSTGAKKSAKKAAKKSAKASAGSKSGAAKATKAAKKGTAKKAGGKKAAKSGAKAGAKKSAAKKAAKSGAKKR